MSTASIAIELPPESQALIKRFADMANELPQAIKRGMDDALEVVAGRIIETRLSGVGPVPFPPEEHILRQVSGLLVEATRATPATIAGTIITGAIGTSARNRGVSYPLVHEFGFQGEVRYRTKTGKTATRQMNMPERAPFRTGIEENKEFIADRIGQEIEASVNP